MANVSSSSSTSTTNNAYSSHGLSGFASGLDTESMVQAMLQSTQNRIDAQNQKITKLEWTQSIYRDVIKQVQAFQSKYFSYSSATSNLKSNSFWNTMKVASSNAAISVVNKSATTSSNMSISSVKQLATATTQYGKSGIVGNVSLDLTSDVTSYIKDGSTVNVNVSLDGVSKTIELSGSTQQEVVDNLNDSLTKAFGTTVNAKLENGKLVFNTSDDHVLSINASSEDAKGLLGMKTQTVSNKLVLNSSLDTMSFNDGLNGGYFEFEINGTKITASSSDSINDIIERVNSSDAGVIMSYDTLNDCFVMKASSTGANVGVKLADGTYGISIKDTTGNLMNTLMGAESSNSVGTAELKSNKFALDGGTPTDIEFDTAKSFVMKVDGKEVEYTINSAEDKDDLLKQLNKLIQKDYADISVSADENGKISLSGGNYEIELSDAKDGSLNEMLGFTTAAKNYNEITVDSTLGDIYGLTADENGNYTFTVGSETITLTKNSKISELISKINTAAGSTVASFADGKINVDAASGNLTISDSGTSKLVEGLFGSGNISLSGTKPASLGRTVQGQNAILTVNGKDIERNSNSFELDGLQITLNATYNTSGSDDVEAINLSSTKNTETIVTTIKEFVTAYNEMMTKVNDLLNESTKDLKKYPPLTEAQKKEMTEKEIELWEEKAKVGLLANDSLLSSMKSNFRSMLYSKVEGGLALYDIGITTNTDGTLKIDESKLQSMVETEGSRIAELFTDSEKGIAIQMDELCTRYAKQSISSPGILVQRAGVKNSSTENQNYISRQIQDLQNYLKRLQSQYDDRKSRYWKQFTSLETMVSNSNATSSYLSNMFTY